MDRLSIANGNLFIGSGSVFSVVYYMRVFKPGNEKAIGKHILRRMMWHYARGRRMGCLWQSMDGKSMSALINDLAFLDLGRGVQAKATPQYSAKQSQQCASQGKGW